MKFFHSLDDDPARPGPFDFRSHGDEEICEIHDLRFLGGPINHSGSLGQHGSHHHVVRAQDSRAEFSAHGDGGPSEVRGENFNVARLDAYRCPQRLESLEVKIDRAVADDASAGQGDGRFFFPAEQRAQNTNRGAHFPHDIVGGFGGDLFRLDGDDPARPLDLASQLAEDREHVVDVAQVRNPRNHAGLLGQQRRGKDRQSGIFRAADPDRSAQAAASVNKNFIHVWR